MLPDDVLLIIFDFYVHEDLRPLIQWWTRLAHVCRRWRSVVFQSPHRLNLRLICTPVTPVREILDIWPPLPLIIQDLCRCHTPDDVDNILAALEHNDRVCQIEFLFLDVIDSQFEFVTS